MQNGFLLIFSGDNERCAGVGFIISPGLRKAVYNFDCLCGRMAAVKVRVAGGKIAFITAYAPQSEHTADKRNAFFSKLGSYYESISVNGEKYVCGDFNSRLRMRFPNEENIIGEHFFQGILKMPEIDSNRNFLMQFAH